MMKSYNWWDINIKLTVGIVAGGASRSLKSPRDDESVLRIKFFPRFRTSILVCAFVCWLDPLN